MVDPRQRSSSDVSRTSSVAVFSPSPRSSAVVSSPNMLPVVSPSIIVTARSSPLMTPHIPLSVSARDSGSGLSPIPQSPATADMTPMPMRPVATEPPSGVPIPAANRDDYFSLRTRRGSLSTSTGAPHNVTTPDDFSSWGGRPPVETPVPQTPSTPSAGGLIGRLKALGKGARRQTSEPGGITSPTVPGAELAETHTVSCIQFVQLCSQLYAERIVPGCCRPAEA